MMGKVACAATWLGVLCMLLAAVAKLTTFHPLGLAPKALAATAALLYLLSIALHSCISACRPEKTEKP